MLSAASPSPADYAPRSSLAPVIPPTSIALPAEVGPTTGVSLPLCDAPSVSLSASPAPSSLRDDDFVAPSQGDLSTLPSLLASLETVVPSLVAVRELPPGIITDAEALSQASRPVARELLVKESPVLASFISAAIREVRGFDQDAADLDPLVLGPKPLKTGQFLPLNRNKVKPFAKPSPPIALSALPARSLALLETEKALLPSHDGKSAPSRSATISDHILQDWEESQRLALESSSLLESFIDILYKDAIGKLPGEASLSGEQMTALLLTSSKCAKANLHLQSRSHINFVLARRDALLAKSKSRVPAAEKDILRALPLDSTGLLGPKALLSPSLQPLSENNKVLLEVVKTLKSVPARNAPSDRHRSSPAKKRSASESFKGKNTQGGENKKPKFAGKAKKDFAGPKPSPSKKAASPP